jgi:gamma-glutamyltranspeptidase / glutathione hydrolase
LKKYGHYAGSDEALYYLMQISRIEGIFANAPAAALKTLFPEIDPSPDRRLTTETSRLLWARIQRQDWWREAQTRSALGASNHSAGVLAIDEHGNVASVLHSCNCVGWGSTAIFVDGISIPDSANFQQQRLAAIGPGVRLPEGTNPLIVLKGGKPVLASTTIGSALHEATLQNLINVLDFGMDPKTAVDQPNTQGPFYGISATGPAAPEFDKEAVGPGDFSDAVLDGVRARGQAIKMVPGSQQIGYWIGIQIDPATGQRTGGVTSKLPAFVEGY